MILSYLDSSWRRSAFLLACAAALAGCGTEDATRPTGGGRGGANNNGGGGNGGVDIGGGGNGGNGGNGGIGVGDDGGPPNSKPPIPSPTTPFVKDDTGLAMLDGATVAALKMGGTSCAAPILYPYDGTMVPVGGIAPALMVKGAADAAYVKMTYGDPAHVLYEFAVAKSDPVRIKIPDDAWNEVSSRTSVPPAQQSPLQITVTTSTGGMLSTCKTTLLIAPGRLDGALYYNSYDDPGAQGQGSILRLFMGDPAPSIFIKYTGPLMNGPCVSCHSVAAKGGVIEGTEHDYSALTYNVFAWDIQKNPAPLPPKISNTPIQSATFGALTPDGSVLLTMGNPDCTVGADTYPRAPNNFPLVEGSVVAKLWDIQKVQELPANGLNKDWYMWMPQFSPNGDKVVFNHAKPGPNGRTDRRELATMDYDAASHTFSNLQVIYHDDGPAPDQPYNGYTASGGTTTIPKGANGCTTSAFGGTVDQYTGMITGGQKTWNDTCTDLCYPGWPFFTPDGKKVVFVRGTQPDFASMAPGLDRPNMQPSASKLFIVDLATKAVHALDNANGAKPDGTAFIPDPAELSHEYFPTVMPIAAGGQFWLFWTSRRTYGNVPVPVTVGGVDVGTVFPGLGGLAPPGNPDAKKIWVSAVDIDAPGNVDPSHPAFYLQGQGISGNIRAFPTLSPCKGDGLGCGTGIDCCSGYCIDNMCGSLPPTCAKTQDKCSDSADCCDKSQRCYGGFCAVPPPPR